MAGAPQANDPAAFNLDALASIAGRLEATLDAETQALRQNRACDLGEICLRKRQGLLELSRITAQFTSERDQHDARNHLGRLSRKLEQNRVVLDIQLRAVREVADIIAHTMRDAESDGTYSKSSGSP